ncbi:unnamed protein product [Rhizophagus irregularis]|nr:unnamed protein product [Rhizophagus irregularis]CAB5383907.1 unnamed protein product [Rhizophagus irregularis]
MKKNKVKTQHTNLHSQSTLSTHIPKGRCKERDLREGLIKRRLDGKKIDLKKEDEKNEVKTPPPTHTRTHASNPLSLLRLCLLLQKKLYFFGLCLSHC